MKPKERKQVIHQFMEESGYTEGTNNLGIRKDHKGNKTWDFYKPSEMLDKFLQWFENDLRKNNTQIPQNTIYVTTDCTMPNCGGSSSFGDVFSICIHEYERQKEEDILFPDCNYEFVDK